MLLTMQSQYQVSNPSVSQLRTALCELDGDANSFAHLEETEGTYIQVGGGPYEFIVEVRVTNPDGTFRQWRARQFDVGDTETRQIVIGGQKVVAARAEALSWEMVITLFTAFLDGGRLASDVDWREMIDW